MNFGKHKKIQGIGLIGVNKNCNYLFVNFLNYTLFLQPLMMFEEIKDFNFFVVVSII